MRTRRKWRVSKVCFGKSTFQIKLPLATYEIGTLCYKLKAIRICPQSRLKVEKKIIQVLFLKRQGI